VAGRNGSRSSGARLGSRGGNTGICARMVGNKP
jgi:hypothetical protein